MPANKFYLSFARHGHYGNDTPIIREDMLKSFWLGKQLKDVLPPCSTVYHSPLARAECTAMFEALGLGCNHLLSVKALTEDTPKFEIQKFINALLQNTDSSVQYYHFVTHLPVVEKLGLPFIGAGDLCLLTADSLDDMLAENFQTQVLHLPELSSDMYRSLNLTIRQLNDLTPPEIYNLLKE